jgi:hypothetical protein
MATTSWSTAAPYIVASGQRVLPMGGFSGTVPEPTLTQFKQLVHSGQLKFVLVGAAGRFGFGPRSRVTAPGTVSATTRWIESTCTAVPAVSALAGALYQCPPSAR